MEKILDPNHPFFAPVWRRWATTILPGGWALFEAFQGSPGWALLFAALSAFAFYMLIIKGPDAG